MQELVDLFPHAQKIARPGQINAWDNDDFVKAIEETGKKQLIIAGVVTDVCVAFPALSAIKAGYEVFAVTDASGTFSKQVADAANTRMAHNGVQLMNWFSVACELHRVATASKTVKRTIIRRSDSFILTFDKSSSCSRIICFTYLHKVPLSKFSEKNFIYHI
ncbi:Nicotinamidase family protein YcaC [Bacillus cereus]|nr:Nicotinamidase family protein YcaC [Bacillus cereus]